LWLVVKSAEPKYYFFPVQPDAEKHAWVARDVQIGYAKDSPGEAFTIYAALLTDEASRMVNTGDYADGFQTLPKGSETVAEARVQRTSDTRSCA
jgi:hypothetical protein